MTFRDTIESILERDPLIAFSVYTHIQTVTLRSMAASIRSDLDAAVLDDSRIDATRMNSAYGAFWLWTLGAYEVLRTMAQATGCFAPRAADEIKRHKQHLEKLRIPFAKQEYAGNKKRAIASEASISSFGIADRDFSFDVEGQTYSVRMTLDSFERLIASISRSDVLAPHRTSYRTASGP